MCRAKGKQTKEKKTASAAAQSEAELTLSYQMTDKHLIFFLNADPRVDRTPFNMQNTHKSALK